MPSGQGNDACRPDSFQHWCRRRENDRGRVSHFTTPEGSFESLFKAMPLDLQLPCFQRTRPASPTAAAQDRYYCSGCDASVWGKAGAALRCWVFQGLPGGLEGLL